MGHIVKKVRDDKDVISIHPSRVGWDEKSDDAPYRAWVFQSTHPVWDGTFDGIALKEYAEISIHPSRVGWDIATSYARTLATIFQSTHPVWDGTRPSEIF